MIGLLRPTSFKRKLFFLAFDTLLSLLSLFLAYNLRFNFKVPEDFLHSFAYVFFILLGLKILFFSLFHLYKLVWRFFGVYDAKNIIRSHFFAYGIFALLYVAFEPLFEPFPRSVIVIDFVLSLFFIGGLRGLKRVIGERYHGVNMKPTLIIGVETKTKTIIQSALNGEISYYPVAIIACLPKEYPSVGAYIQNLKVYGEEELEEVVRKKEIEAVIIVDSLTTKHLQAITARLNALNIYEIKQVKLLGSKNERLEDLSIEDLLARHPKDLDKETIQKFIAQKSVLITGAGGSIGSEIALQCHSFGASMLILVDHAEYNLYQIKEKLPNATAILLDIVDRERLRKVFEKFKPDIVIHAAAYKHVPLCEENQEVAVRNNILGSKNVIDVSIQYGVQKVVIISTDKAVRPTNIMGATKRVVELYAGNVVSHNTEIVVVRFGNVLGSSGSVIPKFKAQIEAGGAVTVTHPQITRYFMLIPEACQLVLQAAAIAQGGELFILDMGEPIRIVDLARQMIRLYGKEDEVEIVFSGLRAGEKLYEELLLDESEQKTQYSSIFIARSTYYDIDKLNIDIDRVLEAEDKVIALQAIVPEFEQKV